MRTIKTGDKVALIAPASGQHKNQETLIEQAAEVLNAWGLEIVQMPELSALRYLASDDATRAQSLKDALTHPEIKAIFVTRGGYGSARLLPLLGDISAPSPRYLIGFSDITTLHLHFENTANMHCLHASNVATELFLSDNECAKRNRDSLHAYLFNGYEEALTLSPLFKSRDFNNAHNDWQKASKTGGCLSLLVTSLGTAHEIDTVGKVVMIEEVCEPPYKIDRMLTHLKNAGKFASANAVVFGDLTSCDIANINAIEVIKDVMRDVNCPVYHSPTFGHGELNLPWVYRSR